MSNIGSLQRATGRLDEADRSIGEAITLVTAALGSEHSDLVDPLIERALLAVDRRRIPEAEKDFKAALTIADRQWSRHHPNRARVLLNYAKLLRKEGRTKEARRLEAEMRKTMRAQPDSPSPVLDVADANARQEKPDVKK
jgi:hypothetical protein